MTRNSTSATARRALAMSATMVALFAASHASAADLYSKAPPYTVPAPLGIYSWAGPYLGASVGYNWGNITNNPTSPSGLLGGVQGGYNWQSGALVFGGEADLNLSGADDTFAPWQFTNPWFGTARVRVGYASNNILVYGTAGLSFGSIRGNTAGLSESHVSAGWTAGVGAEFGLTPNWSAKAEYLYVDLANRNFSITSTSNGYEFSVVRVGVNYKF